MTKTYKVLASAAVVLVGTIASAGISNKKGELISGCDPDMFVQGAQQNVIDAVDQDYSPRCLRVKAGSSVTINADQTHHLSPVQTVQGSAHPFGQQTSYDTPQSRILTEPGTYGYYCDEHGDATGKGMTGAIIVEQDDEL